MHVSLVLALLLTFVQGDTFDKARKAYSNCIIDAMHAQLESEGTKEVFQTEANAKCTAQRAKYREAIITEELKYGASRKEAEEYADEEAEGLLAGWVDGFNDYKATNTRPTKER